MRSTKTSLASLALILAAACTTKLQLMADAGLPDGAVEDRDAGPPGCKVDLDCAIFHTLCNVADGGCVLPPHPCDPSRAQNGGSQCNGQPAVANCYDPNDPSTNVCFCKPDHTSDAGGYCYPQLKPCASCTSNIDCGAPNSGVDNVGTCTTFDAPASSSVCLRYTVGGSCDGPTGGGFQVGRTVDGGTLCECPSMTCPCGPCSTDADCTNPAVGVCARGQGVCEAPCLPGLAQCPTVGGVQQVCHVMDKYLDPKVPLEYYGGGRCGPPCTTDQDCQSPYYANQGGVPLRCETNTHVCRPPIGWCIADFECGGTPHPDASVSPFCDVWADGGASCNGADCRLGTDTHDITAPGPFQDCITSYACLLPDGGPPSSLPAAGTPYGYGVCELLPCYLIDPLLNYGCVANYLCCGAGDAGAANPACTLGDCYYPPRNPWCTPCTDVTSSLDPVCAGLTGFVQGATFCTQERGGKAHCGLSCDKHEPWTCPSGASCYDQGYPFNTYCFNGMTPVQLTELDATGTDPLFGCNCNGAKCPTTPIAATGVTFDVAACSACPDPTPGTGCLPDNGAPGQFACVCHLDAGGGDCAAISGATTTTCVDLGAPNPPICEIGTKMVWDDKENAYALGMNCTVRTCSDAGY